MISEVYNEDCMLGMARYPDKYFNLAIVDPPYGLPKDATHGRGQLKDRIINRDSIHGWDIAPDADYFTELFRVSKNQIIWGGNYFNLPPTRGFAIWDKDQPFENFSGCEFAWTSFDCPAKIKRIATTRTGEDKIHPTQKPIQLYKWLLKNYAQQGDKILDTHLGSGSSRIACDALGFDFVGFELDKDYFEAQEKRFSQYKSQLVMF